MGSKVGKTGLRYLGNFGDGKRGYFVRIPCPINVGKYVTKDFSSASLALRTLLAKARAWRDDTYLSLYGRKIPDRTIHRKQANNRATAMPGVRRQTKNHFTRIGERKYSYKITYYIAEIWLVPGLDGQRSRKSRSKVFSIRKYGEDAACGLAIKWRKEMETRLLHDGPEKFEKWWKTVKGTGISSTYQC